MMRRFSIVAVVAIVLAAGGVAVANGDSTTSTREDSGKVIKLFAPLVQEALIDLGDPGFSLGDKAVFSDDLLTRKNGQKVGFDAGECTVVRVADARAQSGTLQCLVTHSLNDGQIATQGFVTLTNGQFTGTQVAAITGGTGRFSEADGENAVEFLGPGEANITLTLAD
jgi:hypothetical protein